jgi:sulfatase modifying factor 1
LQRLAELVRALSSCVGILIGGALLIASAVERNAAAQAPASTAYRETIPGTVVGFEMVPVPAGTVTTEGAQVAVDPFLIARTEVTWDVYDVFAFGLDVAKGGTVDATARPSQPYGAPDYGWGHAGYPVISVTHDAAEAFCTW